MYHIVPVHPDLRPFVREIRIQTAQPSSEVPEPYTVLPGPFAVLGIRMSGELRLLVPSGGGGSSRTLATSGITGLQDLPRRYLPQADARSILVRFRPDCAFALFGLPMEQMMNGELALDELLPTSDVRLAEERVQSASCDAEAGAAVTWLLTTAARRSRVFSHRAVAATMTAIIAQRGNARIAQLARENAISCRQLERLFRAQVGMPPKRIAALARFAWAAAHLRPGVPLSRLALSAGYADQAHFTRAVARFAHSSPTRLLESIGRGDVSQSFNT